MRGRNRLRGKGMRRDAREVAKGKVPVDPGIYIPNNPWQKSHSQPSQQSTWRPPSQKLDPIYANYSQWSNNPVSNSVQEVPVQRYPFQFPCLCLCHSDCLLCLGCRSFRWTRGYRLGESLLWSRLGCSWSVTCITMRRKCCEAVHGVWGSVRRLGVTINFIYVNSKHSKLREISSSGLIYWGNDKLLNWRSDIAVLNEEIWSLS